MFRNRLAISIAALLVLSSTAAVDAQGQGRGGRGRGFGFSPDIMKVNLLAVPQVQEDLKLSDEQKSQAQAITEKMASDRQDAFSGLSQDSTQEERQKKFAEFQEKSKAHAEAAAKLLTKEQTQRLDQIVIQAQGVGALNDEKIAQTLKLTDDQKQKLQGLSEEIGTKMREVGFGEGSQEKRAELQKELTDKSLAALTEDQRSEFAKLQGEKLDLPFGAAFGFGGGRGGRGRGRPQ